MQIMVSCGPVKLAARLLDSCLELRRVICISTSSIFTKTASSDSQEQELIKNIISDEKKLKSSCEKRNIELLLLRPTLIYGCGLDKNISRLALLIKRFGFIPLAGKASGMRQPVHADDLAKLVMAAINKIDLPSFESPVSGGTTLSYRDMVNRVFDALDQPSKILSLPPAILIRLLKVLTWIPGMGDMNAEFVLRQNRDMVFDDSRLREILGATAQPFQPTTSDFEIPKRAGSLQPR
jgi:nucleoside-diphosphate-sugar epimerase